MTSDNKILDHESRISVLEEAVRQICTNHIPHIERDIGGLAKDFKSIKTLLFGALVSLALTLVGLVANLIVGR